MEVALELCAVVRLDYEHSEPKPSDDLVHKADGRLLVAHVVDLQHSDAGAVIDGGELTEAFPGARNPLKEFDVDLQSVPRLWLLVSMPGAACRLALLIGRQAVHPITDQDAVYRGPSYIHVMKAV